jgi:CheY-like chemotaxis protein/nucleotide-binding universal stress UspA family protein
MTRVVAAVSGTVDGRHIIHTARIVAAVLRGDVETVHVGEEGAESAALVAEAAEAPLRVLPGAPVDAIVQVVESADVTACVLGANTSPIGGHGLGHVAAGVIERTTKPVVVVPLRGTVPSLPGAFHRVLVPLDGTEPFVGALATTVRRLVGKDAALTPLHVFTRRTTPAVMDHPAHDLSADQVGWCSDFLARVCPDLVEPIRLERGQASEAVIEIADSGGFDLIVLTWGQQLLHGHGRVVQEVLAASPVPVLVLPSTTMLQPATVSASPQVVDGSGHPVELLLVEDEPGDVQLTREALDEVGLRNALHVVDDEKCALMFLRQEPPYQNAPRPGLVLLDLEMRGTEGRDLLATIKEDPQLRSIPVVALTTSTAEADVDLAYRLGANCLVTTPVRFSEFVKAVRAIGRFWFATATLPSEPGQAGTVPAQSTDMG